jgi:hypothetical protein
VRTKKPELTEAVSIMVVYEGLEAGEVRNWNMSFKECSFT